MKRRTQAMFFASIVLLAGSLVVTAVYFPGYLRIAKAASMYYVATTGNDSNDCLSEENACLTLNGALGKISAGDTINVGAGTYSEDLGLGGGQSFTLIGDNRESTIMQGAFLFNGGPGPYGPITIQNLTINATGKEIGIDIRSGWSDVTVENVNITGANFAGIGTYGDDYFPEPASTNIMIRNVRVSASNYGVTLGGCTNNTITNSVFFSNQHGINIQDSNGCDDISIINNTFVGNVGDGIGSFLSLNGMTGTIRNNIIVNSGNYGINFSGGGTPENLDLNYNNIFGNTSGNYFGISAGTGDISADPLFTDADSNNYTLQSTSPSIDAGDPTDSVGSEPAPHGGRINQGAYGGTASATSSIRTVVYVDAANGNDATGDGTTSLPYASISRALNFVAAGTMIYAAGTLTEQVTFTSAHSGTSGSVTTLQAWSGHSAPIIDATGNSRGIYLNNADYITLSGFTVKNGTALLGGDGEGIAIFDGDNITLSNITIYNNADHGIEIDQNSSSVTLTNNTIYSNGVAGISNKGTQVTVSGSTIYSNTGAGIDTKVGSDFTLKNNIVYNNSSSGITVAQNASAGIIYNNVIYGHIGANRAGILFFESPTMQAYNNTLYGNTSGIFMNYSAINPSVTLKNNIIAVSGSGAYGIVLSAPNLTDYSSNYNTIYPVNGAYAGSYNTLDQTTLTNWQTTTSSDVNSLSSDPFFVSTVSGSENFRLAASSSAIDAGTTISSVTTDISGVTRPYGLAYDQGAYENDGTAPVLSSQSPASGATSVSADANISFVLTDSDTGVDTSTLTLTVGGIAVTPLVSGVSTPNSYSVLYDSSSNFTAGSSVTVSVSVSDLALSANTLSTSWSFTVASSSGSSGIAGGSSLPSSPISQGSSPIIPDISSSIDVIESTPAETSTETAPESSLKKSSAWRIDPALRELLSEHIDTTDDPERLACEGFTQKDLQAARALFRNIAQAKITVSRFIYSLLPEIAGTISDLADISIMVESDLSEKRVSMKNGEISLKIYLNALSKKLDVMWGINIDHILIASREYFETHYFKTIDLSDKQSVVLDCPWMVMKEPALQESTIEPGPTIEPEPSAEPETPTEPTVESTESEIPAEIESAPPTEPEILLEAEPVSELIPEFTPASEFETPVEQEISAESALPLEPTAVPELTTLSELETVSEPESNTSDLAGGSSLTAALVAETPIETVTVSAVTDLECETYSGSSDEDIDGLSDRLECVYGTDPKNAQTNGENLDSDIVINRVDLLASAVVSTMEPAQSDAQPASPVFIAITNYNGATKTASSTPLFRGVATPTDASVCIWAENTSGNTRELGCSAISENQKFLFKTPEPLLDDTYTVTAKLVQFGTVVSESAPVTLSIYSSFDIDPPSVQKLGDVVIPLEIQNVPDQLKIFPIRFRMKRPALSGNAEYNNTVFIDWQSAIFSSALIADTGSGAFTSVTPTELEVGDHSVWMYAVNPELGIRSDEVEVHFTIAEVGESLLRLFAVQGGIAVFVIAGAIFFYAVFFQKKFLKKKRRSGNQV